MRRQGAEQHQHGFADHQLPAGRTCRQGDAERHAAQRQKEETPTRDAQPGPEFTVHMPYPAKLDAVSRLALHAIPDIDPCPLP